MEFIHILLAVIGFGLPTFLVVVVIYRLRQRRLFVHFRLIDEKTQQPVAGAEVFRIFAHKRASHVLQHGSASAFSGGANLMVHGGQQGEEQLTKVGALDHTGAFRGISAGLIGMESVADHGAYPAAPYVCVVRMGMIAPPMKSSGAALGLAPGQAPDRASGFVESYERPELHTELICWPSIEEAKAGSMSGGMSRMWRVHGIKRGPGIGGNSVLLTIEHIEG